MSAGPLHSTKVLGMKGQRATLRGRPDSRKSSTPVKNFNVNLAKTQPGRLVTQSKLPMGLNNLRPESPSKFSSATKGATTRFRRNYKGHSNASAHSSVMQHTQMRPGAGTI